MPAERLSQSLTIMHSSGSEWINRLLCLLSPPPSSLFFPYFKPPLPRLLSFSSVTCLSPHLPPRSHSSKHPVSSRSCFEDDEPPCLEEIEYSMYSCPRPSGAELDLDIDNNNSSSSSSSNEEEGGEEEEEGGERAETSQRPRGKSGGSCLRSRLFPQLISKGSVETLNPKRSQCGRQYLS